MNANPILTIKEKFYWDFLTMILTIFEWKAAADGTMYRPPHKNGTAQHL